MTRIGLIPTGEAERLGMVKALEKAFPPAVHGVSFEVLPGQFDGFTSRTIALPFTPGVVTSNEETLVASLLGAVTDRRSAVDFAIPY
jgi:hypothetical protein